MEVLKLCVCVGMLYAGEARGSMWIAECVSAEFLEKPSEVLRLAVPSFLYLLQNNLLYFALSNLRATPYKVTYNLKILTSALFSVTMLGQKLSKRKWLSLIALFVGVTVVQSDNHKSDRRAAPRDGPRLSNFGFPRGRRGGLHAGFCGVYQQKILQAGKTNMWVRYAQMGLTSVTLGVISTIVKDRQALAERGFFQGYTKLVWTVIIIQAVGGLNVAFILKYADNILKGFAAAFSTVPSCVLEMAIMHFRSTRHILLAAADQRRGLLRSRRGGRMLQCLPTAPTGASVLRGVGHGVMRRRAPWLCADVRAQRLPAILWTVFPNFRDRRGDGDGRLVAIESGQRESRREREMKGTTPVVFEEHIGPSSQIGVPAWLSAARIWCRRPPCGSDTSRSESAGLGHDVGARRGQLRKSPLRRLDQSRGSSSSTASDRHAVGFAAPPDGDRIASTRTALGRSGTPSTTAR